MDTPAPRTPTPEDLAEAYIKAAREATSLNSIREVFLDPYSNPPHGSQIEATLRRAMYERNADGKMELRPVFRELFTLKLKEREKEKPEGT